MKMKLGAVLGVSLAVALCALPAAATEQERECIAGRVTPASYTWNFKAEANQIFKYVRAQAQDANYYSDQLAVLNPDGPSQMDWRNDIDALNHVKADVNRIESRLCRLEAIRRVVEPEQQQTIDRIASTAQLMVDNLENTYAFGNTHSQELWLPSYRNDLKNLYSETGVLKHSTHTAIEQYASLLH